MKYPQILSNPIKLPFFHIFPYLFIKNIYDLGRREFARSEKRKLPKLPRRSLTAIIEDILWYHGEKGRQISILYIVYDYVCIYIIIYICMNMYGIYIYMYIYIWKICIFIFIITCNTHLFHC